MRERSPFLTDAQCLAMVAVTIAVVTILLFGTY
jgi:hypothetical protein